MKLGIILIVFAVSLFCFSCAQIAPLTGGAKDQYPPVLDQDRVHPANYSVNFASKGALLVFDEYFKLDQTKTISINPGVSTLPQFKVKGKKLYIQLDSELEKNTTYTINFGNAIKDIAEGNELQNFKYVFSTGAFIDSLELRGTVYSSQQGIPLEGAIVGLYKTLGDSVPYFSQPNYVGITNSAGWFSIENIKEGTYKTIALTDENGNYKYDEQSEGIGFLKEPIVIDKVDSNASMIKLYAFYPESKKITVIKKVGFTNGCAKVIFNKGVNIERFRPLETSNRSKYIWNSKRDSLSIYTNNRLKKTKFSLLQFDGSKDTISISLSKKPTEFKLKFLPKGFEALEELKLNFNEPISEYLSEDIDLMKDSTRMPITLSINTQNPYQMTVNGNYEPNSKYTLRLDSASIIDATGRAIDSTTIQVSTFKENYLGFLTVNIITNNKKNMFLELLDPKGKLIRISDSFYGAQAINFDELLPGKYNVRLIHDNNFNNQWDTGDYNAKLFPERVINFDKSINVRSNWNLVEDWEIDKE